MSSPQFSPQNHTNPTSNLESGLRLHETYADPVVLSPHLLELALSSMADFAYVFDREGRFAFVNQALLNLWQLTLQEALGKNFFDLNYPPVLATRLQEQVQTVIETGKALRDETEYRSASGVGYYEYIFTPVFNKEGKVEAVSGSTRDITLRQQEKAERELLLKALSVEKSRLSNVLMQAPAFIAVLRGPQHTFEQVNANYLHLVGQRDLIGKPVHEAFPEVAGQGFFEMLDGVYRTGAPFVGKNKLIMLQRQAGMPLEERYLDFVYQPLIEADGSVSGIFVHGIDLTERKMAEEVSEKNAQALALAIEGAQLGTFYCEFPLDKIIWNNTCKDHFFLHHDAEVDFDLFYSILHPEDRERTRRAVTKALEEKEQYNIEYRTVASDGRVRWINAIGKGYYNDKGEPYRFDGITIDISEKKARERILAFLVEINDATREMQDAETIMATVALRLGEFLHVSRCAYAPVEEDENHFTILRDYTNGCLSSTGHYTLDAFGPNAASLLRAGKTLIIRDREQEARPEDNLAAFKAIDIKALVCTALVKESKLVAMMAVHQTEPRNWTSDEITLIEMVAERSWAIIERVSAEQKLYGRAREIETLNARLIRLVREAQHRVKNNLQRIFALTEKQIAKHQEAGSVPLVEFARLSSLVKHLTEVHDLLTRSSQEIEETQRLSSKEALEGLLPMLQQTAWERTIHYSIDEATLTSRQAIALSLILNELVSNALQHGEDKVEVVFGVEGETANLSICDRGPGFPEGFDPGKMMKTGIELIESLIRFDLRGTSQYRNREGGGAEITVTFALPPDALPEQKG